MKRTIFLLSILAFVLTFSQIAFGQSQDITASTNVITQLAIDNSQNVNFGDISPTFSSNPNLNPTDGSESAVSGTNVQFGYILLSGEDSEEVLVEWGDGSTSYTETLTGQDGQSDEIDYEVSVSEEDADATGSVGGTALSNGNPVTINDSENGQHTLWIGGNLSPSSGSSTPIESGSYEGTVTFTIDYSLDN